MKKILAVILNCVLIASSVSGCVSPPKSAETTDGGDSAGEKSAKAKKPANRIAVRSGGIRAEFYDTETDETFVPYGYNHVALHPPVPEWPDGYPDHLTFHDGYYEQEEIERMMVEMERCNANTLRIFISPSGIVEYDTYERGLYAPYMDNFCDLLARAANHGIYVMPVFELLPGNNYYFHGEASEAGWPDDVGGENIYLLAERMIDGKKKYLEDFVGYIKNKEPLLLNAVLGYALENEFYVVGDQAPFSGDSGLFTAPNGKTYDLADPADRQKCYDESMVHFCNEVSKAIKNVDPDAMVAIGMFTNLAVGKSGYNGVCIANSWDNRFPPRLPVLVNDTKGLDFVDLHYYPGWNTLGNNLDSVEWQDADLSKKPVIAGEMGFYRPNILPENYVTEEDAAAQLPIVLGQMADAGLTGCLIWTWDNEPSFWCPAKNQKLREAFKEEISCKK